MAILRDRAPLGGEGAVVFVCDECGEALETGTPDFIEAVRELRAAGWQSVKAGDGWGNLCPGCRED